MRRNGTGSDCGSRSSSGWLSGILSLAGGVGLGAGLLYLLDPDQGAKRRKYIAKRASGLASSVGDYAGESYESLSGTIGNALSTAGHYASEKFGAARDYAGEKLGAVGEYASDKYGSMSDYASGAASHATGGMRGYAKDRYADALAYAQKQVFGETRAEHRLGVTICALSSMALGAALMYAFDPQSGRQRRRQVADKATDMYNHAGDYARQAGDAIKSGYNQVVEKGSDLAGKTGDAIKSGYNQVADKVGAMAGGGGGSAAAEESAGRQGGAKQSKSSGSMQNQAST
jgi:hypothetical protein